MKQFFTVVHYGFLNEFLKGLNIFVTTLLVIQKKKRKCSLVPWAKTRKVAYLYCKRHKKQNNGGTHAASNFV